jgi:sugar (pentulose or hexulose) kinase
MRLLATTLGRPLEVLNDASWVGVRGAWHAARVAEGEASSWAIPADGRTVQPTQVPGLEARYRTFREATDALQPVFKRAVSGA